MNESSPREAELAARQQVSWTDDRVDAALASLHGRRRARRTTAIAASLLAVTGVVALLLTRPSVRVRTVAVEPPRAEPARAVAVDRSPPAPLALGDGSVVTPLASDTRLETGEISPEAVTIRLRAGGARFQVTHQPDRVFRVVSGEVSIIDTGTEFAVTREDRGSLVEVFEGSVRVEWAGGAAEMVAGERRRFPPVDEPTGAGVRPAPSRSSAEPLPTSPSPEATPEDVEALLTAADEARFRHDPVSAAESLARIVRDHPSDPRAPLSAFTLGRVYLDDLDDPHKAAEAFGKARALQPEGPLAEDALAREVEAWVRAGDEDTARTRASLYLSTYPEGRRSREVRKRTGVQ